MSLPIERINLEKPRWDQTTYMGRLKHFFSMTDPRTLLIKEADAQKALELVTRVLKRQEGWKKVAPEEAWEAKRIVDSVYHPDTKKPIPRPWRFSAFAPMNLLIVLGLTHPSQQTPLLGVTWQWINQTYNVAVNYANRNVSTPTTTAQVLQSYALAVGVSCSVSLLGGRLARAASPLVKIFIPYTAVSLASMSNAVLMRSSDLTKGIAVRDVSTGEPIPGFSKNAGRKAVTQVAMSRAIIAFPLLTLPPALQLLLFSPKVKFLYSRPHLAIPVNLTTLTLTLLFTVPPSLAAFAQEMELPVESLEKDYQNLKNSKGQPIKRVIFNKGL